MLDKVQMSGVEEKELGVGLQFSISFGENKGLGFTAGFPLEWETSKINALVDKLLGVAERQVLKAEIKKREASLREDYRQLETNLQQQANHKNNLEFTWVTRGKQGAFTMTDAQKAEHNRFEANIQMFRKAIAANEKELEAWREQCR